MSFGKVVLRSSLSHGIAWACELFAGLFKASLHIHCLLHILSRQNVVSSLPQIVQLASSTGVHFCIRHFGDRVRPQRLHETAPSDSEEEGTNKDRLWTIERPSDSERRRL